MYKICTIIDKLSFTNPRLHGVLDGEQEILGTLKVPIIPAVQDWIKLKISLKAFIYLVNPLFTFHNHMDCLQKDAPDPIYKFKNFLTHAVHDEALR